MEPNKYATLPNKLSNILGNIGKCDGLITDKTNCFVRKGIESNKQYFISCLLKLINNDNINTLEEFYNAVDDNMTPLDYIELNNGNTLKLYLNTDKTIYDKKIFKEFKEWFINKKNKDYINIFNLKDLLKYINTINEYKYDDENKFNNALLREYMIYNSFNNFKFYLRSDLIKNHEELLQLFTNNYSWLNVNRYNIILIHINFEKDQENIELLCSKFINYQNKINYLNNFIFVLKLKNSYEPIIKVKFRSSEIFEKNNFNYFEDGEFKNIINYQKNNCNNLDLKDYINPTRLYNELELLKYKVKYIVINMGFKVVGFFIEDNLYIPLDSNIFSLNIFKDNNIEIKSYIYLQDIIKYKCNLSLPKIKNIFTLLNDNLKTDFYEMDKSDIILNKNNLNKSIAIILESGIVIPINVTKYDEYIIKENFNDEFIFLGIDKDDNAKSYVSNYMQKNIDYNNKLKAIVKKISTNVILLKKIMYLKNPYNPFPKNIKLDKIKEHILNISSKENIVLDEDNVTNILSDIYIKDLSYILKKNNRRLKISKNEVVYDQEDIIDKKLEKLNLILLNPYKYIQNSIEDYVNYVPILLNKKLVKFNFITDTFIDITPVKWNNLLSSFKVNESIISDSNQQDTKNYLLKIFKKAADLSNNKITIKNMEKHLDKSRLQDFENNNKEFIDEQKMNTYFKKEYNKLISNKEDTDGVYSFENIKSIYEDNNYKYSYYEINKLSKLIKINIILLGDNIKNDLPNGIRCYNNNSKKYILLHIINNKVYDRYSIILKNRNKFIFDINDFNDRFIKSTINKYCSVITKENVNNDTDDEN